MKITAILIHLIVFTFIFSSCSNDSTTNNSNPNGNSGTLPDAVFNANVSGDYSDHWNITIPGNYLSTQTDFVINGGYTTNSDLMILTASILPSKSITINSHTGGVDTGSFTLNTDNMDIATYNDPSIGAQGFVSVSGMLNITKKEYLQTVGTDYDWFVDGTYSINLLNQETPPKSILLAGDFKAMHISPESAP